MTTTELIKLMLELDPGGTRQVVIEAGPLTEPVKKAETTSGELILTLD